MAKPQTRTVSLPHAEIFISERFQHPIRVGCRCELGLDHPYRGGGSIDTDGNDFTMPAPFAG